VHKPDKSGSPAVELKLDADGLPKLNARQRRTLRRAKDRCVAGLIDAGSTLLQAQGDMPINHLSMGSAAAADNGSEDGRDDERLDRSDLYLSAALKVARGEMGAGAAEAAKEILSKVSSDLHEITLIHLMGGLMLVEKPTETIDLNLVQDLRVIRKISEALSALLASLEMHNARNLT
jgi:hypothetical protein